MVTACRQWLHRLRHRLQPRPRPLSHRKLLRRGAARSTPQLARGTIPKHERVVPSHASTSPARGREGGGGLGRLARPPHQQRRSARVVQRRPEASSTPSSATCRPDFFGTLAVARRSLPRSRRGAITEHDARGVPGDMPALGVLGVEGGSVASLARALSARAEIGKRRIALHATIFPGRSTPTRSKSFRDAEDVGGGRRESLSSTASCAEAGHLPRSHGGTGSAP